MRYAILSDVHSNLEALETVLQKLKKIGYDKLLFLGDFIGYGANPNECMEILREASSFAVLGNHDAACLHPEVAENFNTYAKEAIAWTRSQLKEEHKDYLKLLPYRAKPEKDILIVHSTPRNPKEWDYLVTILDAYEGFDSFKESLCFLGHSHIPVVFSIDMKEVVLDSHKDETVLKEGYRYLINPGAVGQPRDRNPCASFGILDTEKGIFKLYRIEYPVEITQKKIREKGLPGMLADRLEIGI